jgi:hypothetical protein
MIETKPPRAIGRGDSALAWDVSPTARRLLCFNCGPFDRASDYESGGREFESLRARQHLAPTFRAKNTANLRNLQGTSSRQFWGECTRASGCR